MRWREVLEFSLIGGVVLVVQKERYEGPMNQVSKAGNVIER